jgi:hypothetical protein
VKFSEVRQERAKPTKIEVAVLWISTRVLSCDRKTKMTDLQVRGKEERGYLIFLAAPARCDADRCIILRDHVPNSSGSSVDALVVWYCHQHPPARFLRWKRCWFFGSEAKASYFARWKNQYLQLMHLTAFSAIPMPNLSSFHYAKGLSVQGAVLWDS